MKILAKIIVVALALLALGGCENTDLLPNREKDEDDGYRMVAEIIAVGDKLEVEVIEGEYGASGIYLVNVGEATLYRSEGGSITKDDLSAGDKIEIIYSGQVMMSYPPQIVAKQITKL